MLEIASQIILCLLLAALLGFIIGYILGKSTCASSDCDTKGTEMHQDTASSTEETSTVVAPIVAVATETASTPSTEPVLLSEPRNGEKDNLTRIKGIGVKIDETLNEIGIYHFDQIASWNEENIAWVDANVAFPGRVKRENWIKQAKALAAGEETEFSKRVDNGEVSSSKDS